MLLRLVKRGLVVKEKGNGKRFTYQPNSKLLPISMASITKETAPVLMEDYADRVTKATIAEAKEKFPLDVVKQALFVATSVNANAGSKYAVEIAEGKKVNLAVALEEMREKEDIATVTPVVLVKKTPDKSKSPAKKSAPNKHAKKASTSGLDDFW